MASTSAFWDRLADRYAAQPIADEAAYQTKLATTRRHLRADMELLEFGCGTGSTALVHAPYVKHIRAIDFSARMIEIARSKAADAGIDNVHFEQGDIGRLDYAPASFDMVLGLSVLHLLEDKRAAIATIYSALKPGGLFVSSTACIQDMLPLLALVAPLGRAVGLLPHLDIMSKEQLLAALAEPGFAIEHEWQPNRKAAVFIIARKPDVSRL